MVEVSLENLTKIYGDIRACWHVNLTVKDREFFCLLGPSGCGKTTALRMISGLEEPTEGDVYFDGERVTDKTPQERNIAMVFQSWALYPHMTSYDNIAFPLKIRGWNKEEINNKVKKVAEHMNIDHLLDHKPSELSGGEQQRTALGRAVVREPNVFLMDEPLANLDAKLRVRMRAELKRLHKKLGITTIYVTHDQIEAMSMAHRVGTQKDGVLQQVGTPHELFNSPKNAWVARFIGSPPMNLLECSLKEEDGNYLLEGSGFSYPIIKEVAREIKEHNTEEKLKFGVRPRDIKVFTKEKAGTIEAEMYEQEPTGERVIIDANVGDELVKAEFDSPKFNALPGDKLWLKPVRRTYLYDKNDKLIWG